MSKFYVCLCVMFEMDVYTSKLINEVICGIR